MPRRDTATPYTQKIGARIRELRNKRLMSLSELSEATGLVKSHLSAIENGLVAISAETVDRIASGLRVPPLYIFALPDEDEHARFADLLLRMSPRELKQLRIEILARFPDLVPKRVRRPKRPTE